MFLRQTIRGGMATLLVCWAMSGSVAGNAECDIPNFPNIPDPNSITLDWCPGGVGVQVSAIAVLAATQHCMISIMDASDAGEHRSQRDAMCEHLDQFDRLHTGSGPRCLCPDYMR